ncbi:MAG: DUF2764 family protein [Rikenellaceae bacterium]|nr:DUF2764 family protein [Rikenellaceae bacterium]
MFSSSYYALVAGLREYSLDTETKGFDIEEILAEVEEALSTSDMKVVELLYAYYDCENLISRHNGSSTYNSLGRLSSEEIDEELKAPSRLIAPLAKVVRAYASPESEEAEDFDLSQPFAKALMNAYYRCCETSKSRLLREWSKCDRTIRNIVAATLARKQGVAIEAVVVGEDSVTESLLRSSAADFGLRAELPYVEAIVSAVADERNFIEKERKIDNIRWAELSELATFDYFDLNAVIAYLMRANMVARWVALDAKVGREMFDRLVAELDGKEMINKL